MKIARLLRHREYRAIVKLLGKRRMRDLSDAEKSALLEAKAALLDIPSAKLYLEDLGVTASAELRARILYQAQEYSAALEIARTQNLPKLEIEIHLALGNTRAAREVLRRESVDAWWYYQNSRVQAREFHYDKAIASLEEALLELRRDDRDPILETLLLSNLAAHHNTIGQVRASEKYLRAIAPKLSPRKFRGYPESFVRILINIGFLYAEHGQSSKALRCYVRATRLLRAGEGNADYARVRLLTAYLYLQLGYVKKALALLAKIKPKLPGQQLDEQRYTIQALTELGSLEKASRLFEASRQEWSGSSDPFFQFYFPALGLPLGRTDPDEYIRNVTSLAGKEAIAYAQSTVAWATKNSARAELALAFHRQNPRSEDYFRDRLTLLYSVARSGNLPELYKSLASLDACHRPLAEAWKEFFLALYFTRSTNVTAALRHIHSGQKFLHGKESFLLNWLLTYVASLLPGSHQKSAFEKLRYYRETAEPLMKCEFDRFRDELFYDANAPLERATQNGEELSLSPAQVAEYERSDLHIVLNLRSEKLFVHGIEKNLRHSPIQWKILCALARENSHRFEKSEIVTKIIGRKRYNPIRDDNSLHVAINRLRKLFPGDAVILQEEGKYFLAASRKIIVVLADAPDPRAKEKRASS